MILQPNFQIVPWSLSRSSHRQGWYTPSSARCASTSVGCASTSVAVSVRWNGARALTHDRPVDLVDGWAAGDGALCRFRGYTDAWWHANTAVAGTWL